MSATEQPAHFGGAAHPGGRRTGIATVCLSGTLPDKLDAAAAAGFDGVEIFENDLIASPWSPERIGQHCADLGLSVDLYQPFRNFEAVPVDVLRSNLRRAAHKFDVMRRLGAELMLVCSSVAAEAVDDDDLAAEQLNQLGVLASEHGMRVAYEALAWGKYVNTYEHSWRIARRADHPAVGICLDSFHILSRGSDTATIRTIPEDKLFFVQLADAPDMHLDVLQWSRHYRLFPGQGAFDLPAFVDQVLAAGYQGPLSLEVFNDVYRQANPWPAAVDAMRSLRALQEDTPATVEESRRRHSLPPVPEMDGHAFTEITVDGESADIMADTLTALGFVHARQHRSKAVQLWQQGDARVLLNHSAACADSVEVAALGLESADPDGLARRAEGLLTPILPRTHRPTEADLESVAAPDGTQMFFCRSDPTDATSWLSDFVPAGYVDSEGIGLTRTDHVALTQPFDHFDEAALFYRSLLGLEPENTSEYAAPFGLMRTRAVTDPRQNVRITLDTALLRRGEWAPAVRDPQHVAFATDDIMASVRAARSRGAPILAIPDNYYDDLDARVDIPDELLAAMREHSVLYDRDEYGEFFHFYTAIIGSRVFFEVVQRVHGYAGCGASNAPVRMAAHRNRRLAGRG